MLYEMEHNSSRSNFHYQNAQFSASELRLNQSFANQSQLYNDYQNQVTTTTTSGMSSYSNAPVDHLTTSMQSLGLHSQNSTSNANRLVLEPGLVNGAPRNNISGFPQQPDKASLYKTELCKKWMMTGNCRYGVKCQFAHGEHELRTLIRHALYKTTPCKSYQANGTCRYGSRCRFIHDESNYELNSVPRLPVRDAIQALNYEENQNPTPATGFEAPNNPSTVRFDGNLPLDKGPSDSFTAAKLSLSKRIPSAPANLNLMGFDQTDSLIYGDDDNEAFGLNFDAPEEEYGPTEAFSSPILSRPHQGLRKNQTYTSLNTLANSRTEQQQRPNSIEERFLLSRHYKHNSASVNDLTRWGTEPETFSPAGQPANTKDIPNSMASVNIRHSMSSSTLNQLSRFPTNRSFSDLRRIQQDNLRVSTLHESLEEEESDDHLNFLHMG